MSDPIDELLGKLQLSADEKKLFDNTLAKNPELRAGWMRQQDYSRKLNEFQTKEREFQAREVEFNEMREINNRNVDTWEDLIERGVIDAEGVDLLTPKTTELQRQLEEAKAAALSGGDMKPEEVEKVVADIVKKAGGATKEEISALIAQESKKIADASFAENFKTQEEKFNRETIPFVSGFSAAVSVVAAHYEKETGEKFTEETHKQMIELMGQKKDFNPYHVEEELLRPFRDKKKTDEEVERRVTERLAEERQTRAESGGEDDLYVPSPGGQKGALRAMMERDSGNGGDFENTIREQARKAAQELVQAGNPR